MKVRSAPKRLFLLTFILVFCEIKSALSGLLWLISKSCNLILLSYATIQHFCKFKTVIDLPFSMLEVIAFFAICALSSIPFLGLYFLWRFGLLNESSFKFLDHIFCAVRILCCSPLTSYLCKRCCDCKRDVENCDPV